MNRPRIVGPLKPTTGPVISPIEVYGTELIVPTGATLPPVCIATGQKMEMRDAHYLPDFLPLEMEAIGETGYKKIYQASGQSMVRLPFSKEGLISRNFRRKIGIALAVIGPVGFVLLAVIKDVGNPGHKPASPGELSLLALGFGIWIFLLWLSFRRTGNNLTARSLTSGKIAISGIDISILQDMLEWQEQHSNNPQI
jgi:hypothetical protein